MLTGRRSCAARCLVNDPLRRHQEADGDGGGKLPTAASVTGLLLATEVPICAPRPVRPGDVRGARSVQGGTRRRTASGAWVLEPLAGGRLESISRASFWQARRLCLRQARSCRSGKCDVLVT